jgi:hypothetical protein
MLIINLNPGRAATTEVYSFFGRQPVSRGSFCVRNPNVTVNVEIQFRTDDY